MVIEMLLNCDYPKQLCSSILQFQKEINAIMHIIEKTFKLNFNHVFGQNLNKI
jgi:hypothetical protein